MNRDRATLANWRIAPHNRWALGRVLFERYAKSMLGDAERITLTLQAVSYLRECLA